MNHIVALSGGKDSTALALMLRDREPREYQYVFTPTGDELPEMVDHWLRLQELLQTKLTPVSSGKSLDGLIRIQRALPNVWMRWCTRMLKIEPFERYVLTQAPCTVYVGIRADEADREGVDYAIHAGVVRRFPFQEWGIGLGGVMEYLRCRGVEIPARTDCANCFFQTLWEWYQCWLKHPEAFARGIAWEDLTGHTLRSPGRDSWPAGLRQLGTLFALGMVPGKRTGMGDRKTMCSVCAR